MDDTTLTRLLDVGQGLLSKLELDALLQEVLGVARELTGAQYAAVGIMGQDGTELERFLTSGIAESARGAIGALPRGHGVLGVLIDDPRPLRLDDVGAHMRSYGFPINHPPMRSFLGVPIVVRGEAWGNLYLTEKTDGAAFTAADEEAMVVLAGWAAIAVANARLYEAATGRRDELERAVQALETTTEISSATSGETELGKILELLAKRGRALVCARTVFVALTDGAELEVVATAGVVVGELTGLRTPLEGSILGMAAQTRRPQRLGGLHLRKGQLLADLSAEAGLIVPLLHRGRAVGVLAAVDRLDGGPEFSIDDERLLQAFAASAANAVATAQNAHTRSISRSIEASETERRRWARELHDETLQELGALRILLSVARRTGDLARIEVALDEAVELVTGGIANLRALISDLRPAALDEIGTQAALWALIERVRTLSGLVVDLDVDLDFEAGRCDERHVPELEETIYRVVQEALTNAVKHADAENLHVTVGETAKSVSVTVCDDGNGFAAGERVDGFGLLGMAERIDLAGGRLDVRSVVGEGTVVAVEMPSRCRAPMKTPAISSG